MTYRNAILIHAFALPVGGILLLAGIVFFALGQFKASQEARSGDYASYMNIEQRVLANETQLAARRPILEAWRRTLGNDFVTNLNNILQTEVLHQFKSDQLQQSVSARAPAGGGLGTPGGQRHSRVQLEFRGGYEPMQETLLLLEGRLPQMQLESASLQPDPAGDGLRFDFTYTAWEAATS